MDSIKKIIKWAVWAFAAFCAFCILVATCSDDENESNNQAQTEQKVEAEKQSEVKETKGKKDDGIVGTYEATDKIGNKVVITLNPDKTATVKYLGGEGKTYYCEWLEWSSVGIEIKSPDEPIELVYEAGIRSNSFIYLKDGWLYAKGGVTSKNPTLRLKLTKK